MSRYASRNSSSRGTTLLYVTGIVAVMLILTAGLSERTYRQSHAVGQELYRSRAEWLMRGAEVLAARVAASQLPKDHLELTSSAGLLICDGASTTSPAVRLKVLVPALRPVVAWEKDYPEQP